MWLLTITFMSHLMIDQASALCFVSERVTTPKALLSQPVVIDDYHCKILCAKMDTCLSYLFDRALNRCSLLGMQDKQQFMCTNPRNEMVRKTEDADCKDSFPEQPIDKEYIRNPDIVTGTILPMDTANALICGTGIAVIDVTLPDNTHAVYGNTAETKLVWDDKLGSWTITEHKIVVYMRSAQCIAPNATELASRESCGDEEIPVCASNLDGYKYDYPIKYYGEVGACVKEKNVIHMQYQRWSDGSLSVIQSVCAYLQCIYGHWFAYGEKCLTSTVKITNAHCANKTKWH